MQERVSNEHVRAALKQHGGICTCTRCLEGRDLLDCRKERDEARKALMPASTPFSRLLVLLRRR